MAGPLGVVADVLAGRFGGRGRPLELVAPDAELVVDGAGDAELGVGELEGPLAEEGVGVAEQRVLVGEVVPDDAVVDDPVLVVGGGQHLVDPAEVPDLALLVDRPEVVLGLGGVGDGGPDVLVGEDGVEVVGRGGPVEVPAQDGSPSCQVLLRHLGHLGGEGVVLLRRPPGPRASCARIP